MTPKDELLAALGGVAAREASGAPDESERGRLIRQWRAAAERLRRRGRPRADTLEDMDTGMRRIAMEVFRLRRTLKPARGVAARSIEQVASRYGMSFAAVKKAAQRHRDLDDAVALLSRLDEEARELRRRLLGVPDDVRRGLGKLPAAWLLAFLRDNDIDGTCPSWMVEVVRDLMSPN